MSQELTYRDRLLIRELVMPKDGAEPLSVLDVAVKFETTVFAVYYTLRMSERRLAHIKELEDRRGKGERTGYGEKVS